MLLKSLAALGVAHLLPGLLAAKLLDLGRSREERLLFALVLGGPISALAYLLVLAAGIPALYGALAVGLGIASLLSGSRSRKALAWPGYSVLVLVGIVVAVSAAYLLTTGSLYRTTEDGTLLLDRALQRDALFHVGIARSLETSYPPRLLSVSGRPVGYHVGYHLQLALWSRSFGIDPLDGLIRVGALFHLALYVLTAYALARRFTGSERERLLFSVLVLASGFGFAAFFRPSVDWWSLAFMDWALASIFLANPLLPALPLLFVSLALLDDYLATGARGALAASAFSASFVLLVKMFLGAQLLAALGLATVLGRRGRRAWTALLALSSASLPVLLHTFLAASGSNTRVSLRPLELVRYSMEKLDWQEAVRALAAAGNLDAPPEGWSLVMAATLLWLVGFLGLRIAGIAGMVRDLRRGELTAATLAWFVALGFPLSLLLRIAPGEAEGLSRLEALNDAGWFLTSSGILLWLWTAKGLSRFAAPAVLALSLPATVQHFVHAASLPPDRIGASRVEAAQKARSLSPPGSLWVEPPDRARPSLLAYLAGRPVVYDPYVGYDYMFVGREEIEFRRHALAQFWSSADPAYAAWFLHRFGVERLWAEGRTPKPAVPLELLFSNQDVSLHRVKDLKELLGKPFAAVGSISMGGRGQPFLGSGFSREEGERGSRLLLPGSTKLYLPLEASRPVSLSFLLGSPDPTGELLVEGVGASRKPGEGRFRVEIPGPEERGLEEIEIEWRGAAPLRITLLSIEQP